MKTAISRWLIRSSFRQSDIRNPKLGIVLVALLFVSGCAWLGLDPSVYQGSGASAPPQAQRLVAPAPQPAPQPEKKLPFGATPPGGEPLWGDATVQSLLPKSPENVGIVVEKLDAATAAATDIGGAFRARDGNWAVAGGNPLLARNGLQVRYGTGSFTGRLGLGTSRTRSSNRQQMFITVRSGTEGTLVMGNDTYVTRLGWWSPRGYLLIAEREFVGRQLVVRPTILSDGRIAIQLWPRFSTRRGQVIDLTQLSTAVTVRDGQGIVIGGLNTADSEVSTVLFGASTREQAATSAIVLTAKIGGLDIDWPKVR
ncbi:MAG: type II and III secretion system protein [Planctomycetes bacterium]|nr:type II and III secretion system protein [Planctomycetota bacterium]